jgi:hypothetical protein
MKIKKDIIMDTKLVAIIPEGRVVHLDNPNLANKQDQALERSLVAMDMSVQKVKVMHNGLKTTHKKVHKNREPRAMGRMIASNIKILYTNLTLNMETLIQMVVVVEVGLARTFSQKLTNRIHSLLIRTTDIMSSHLISNRKQQFQEKKKMMRLISCTKEKFKKKKYLH